MKELHTPVDMDRTYTTVEGTPVRILVTNGPGSRPVIGVKDPLNEGGNLMRWTRRGRAVHEHDDLVDANARPIDVARKVAREFRYDHRADTDTSYESCAIRIVAELEHQGFIKVQ